jgi:hypothetical protein
MLDSRSIAESLVVHTILPGCLFLLVVQFLWLRRTSTRPNPDEKTGP